MFILKEMMRIPSSQNAKLIRKKKKNRGMIGHERVSVKKKKKTAIIRTVSIEARMLGRKKKQK